MLQQNGSMISKFSSISVTQFFNFFNLLNLVNLMNIIALVFSLSLLAFILPGCYKPSEHIVNQNCKEINWYEQGVKDGQCGVQRSLRTEIEDSSKYGLLVDAFAYKEGWHRGIRQFCTPCMGMEIGAQGRPCPCFCPPDLAGPFRAAWYQGAKCYYSPERGCGEGCAKTYFYPEVACGFVTDDIGVPPGCPCTMLD